jgi:hypothetical protein
MNLRQINWRTGVLILCLAASLALSIAAFHASRRTLPDWVEIQEGPVAHGVDKFYRNAYFKGNVEVAGDLDSAGMFGLAEAAGVITVTQTLTPSVSFYQVEPATAITITLGSCSQQGQFVIMYNDVITTATVNSTNLLPATPIVLGQHDIFMGQCDGAAWVLFHNQNN